MMQMIFLSRLGQQLCVPKQERLTALFTGSGTDCVSACNGKWWADAKIRVLENASLHAILSCKEWRTHLHSGKGSGQVPLLLCFAWRPVLRSGASVDFSLRPSVKNWYLILLSGPSLWISNTCSQSWSARRVLLPTHLHLHLQVPLSAFSYLTLMIILREAFPVFHDYVSPYFAFSDPYEFLLCGRDHGYNLLFIHFIVWSMSVSLTTVSWEKGPPHW